MEKDGQLQKLEHKALNGSEVDLARYQTAYIARNYPELIVRGVPRFIIGTHGSESSIVDKIVDARKAMLDASGISAVEADVRAYDGGAMQEMARAIVIIKKAGIQNGLYQHTGQPGDIGWFGILTYNPRLCESCRKDPDKQSATMSPDSDRHDQFKRLLSVEHESAHMLRHYYGFVEKTGQAFYKDHPNLSKADKDGYLGFYEESAAEAYGMLRTIQVGGAEGLAHVRQIIGERSGMAWSGGNMDNFNVSAGLYVAHWGQKHLDTIAQMPAKDLLQIADRAAASVTPEFIIEMNNEIKSGDHSVSGLAVKWREMTHKYLPIMSSDRPDHIVEFDKLYQQADLLGSVAAKEAAILNPLRKKVSVGNATLKSPKSE